MRIGHGYDAHRLIEGRPLIIGGVTIPHEKGLDGHSDADVLTHAVMDAILGAMGMGDIGRHFPSSDPKYKDISSIELLNQVANLMRLNEYGVINIDATIIAQEPKMNPHIPQMIENIAVELGMMLGRVNIKATTEEGMGFTGSGEGIAAHCVCLIEKHSAYAY